MESRFRIAAVLGPPRNSRLEAIVGFTKPAFRATKPSPYCARSTEQPDEEVAEFIEDPSRSGSPMQKKQQTSLLQECLCRQPIEKLSTSSIIKRPSRQVRRS